jgi:hypothetical protein
VRPADVLSDLAHSSGQVGGLLETVMMVLAPAAPGVLSMPVQLTVT